MPANHNQEFERVLRHLERIVGKIERQYAMGQLTRKDMGVLYEGIFVKALVAFEKFLACLFVAILLGKTGHDRRYVVSKITVKSAGAAESAILGGTRYVEWLPYDHTLRRAGAVLRRGRPFSRLSGANKTSIQRWMAIRNTIVHSSAHSDAVYERQVIRGRYLSPTERVPGGFLRSQIRSGVSQFSHILQEMRSIATLLERP